MIREFIVDDAKTVIKPCPFCGAPASIEEFEERSSSNPKTVRFSVGCNSKKEVACMGFQSLTSFARRNEAVAAWNRRAD